MDIMQRLAEPFDPKFVKWKPQAVKGHRALAAAYISARAVMQRLDAVLGIGGWQDDYELLPDGSMLCRLRIKIGGEWVVRCDVGGQSEQPDGGDRVKAACSDALKRAAVKFGIGRYLYALPTQWCDFDPERKQFKSTPGLPAWAIPKPQVAAKVGPPAATQPEPQAPPPRSERSGQPKATLEQVDKILELAARQRWDDAQFGARLKARFGVEAASELTATEADVLIKLIENPPQSKAA